jgi:transposase
MASRGLVPIVWPPFSPDLSPIESIWNRMKDILQELDPQVHTNSQRLKDAVWRACERVTDAEIRAEIRTMHQRCLDVIAAHGMQTEW